MGAGRNEIESLAGRLLRPEEVAVGQAQRDLARVRIQEARNTGRLGDERADAQLTLLATARTRGDVRAALGAVPGGAAPRGLVGALRGVTAVWAGATMVQFAIWVLVNVIGVQWTEPWWLWSLVTGPFVVGPLLWLTEAYYRPDVSGSRGASRNTTQRSTQYM
jgi:hypothetical protein